MWVGGLILVMLCMTLRRDISSGMLVESHLEDEESKISSQDRMLQRIVEQPLDVTKISS